MLLTAPSHHIIIAAFQLNYIDQLELSKIVKNEEYTVDNMYTIYVFSITVHTLQKSQSPQSSAAVLIQASHSPHIRDDLFRSLV